MDSLFTFSDILFPAVGFTPATLVVLVHLLSGLDFKAQKKQTVRTKCLIKK